MADISKITLPNGVTYNLKDGSGRYVLKTGDTMTGNLTVPAERIANTYYGISFGRTTTTAKQTLVHTGIKWHSGAHMPVIHITGYAYGLYSPVEFKIGFYIYSDRIGYCGVTNMGAWSPDVYLFKRTVDDTDYVSVGFDGQCYFLQLSLDLQDEMGKFTHTNLSSDLWSWEFLGTTGNIPEADNGVTCVKVPYRADILNPSKVNNHTVNADVPSGAKFTDTTYSPVTDTEDGLMLSEDKVKLDKLVESPLKSKTFTGVIGTANNMANASYYFGKIVPVDYESMWKISYRYHSYTNNDVRARGYYEVTLTGTANALITYSIFNVQKNTSYRPIYNHLIYRALEPGIVGGYGHLLGWRLYSSWQPTTAASARTFDVDILECDNCEFVFFDTPIKYADVPGSGADNYDAYTELNGTTNGRVRIGQDNNDVNYQIRRYYSSQKVYASTPRYQIMMTKDFNGQYLLPISSVSNNTGTTKTLTTESFNPFGPIYYYNSTTVLAADKPIGSLYRQIRATITYSFNTGATLIAGKPFYIVCVPQSDGLAVLYTEAATQDIPQVENGLIYILLGYAYDTNTVEMELSHPVYVYKNGGIRELSDYSYQAGNASTVNGYTVESNVPTNAKFTDTTYSEATTSENGLMSSEDKNKLDRIGGSYDSNTETITFMFS